MNIVVCVKYVPDATADRHFESDHTVDRTGVPGLLSELDEYAVEQALQLKEKAAAGDGGEEVTITALTVGPPEAADAIKKALQMGADKGVHVVDDAIAGSDYVSTSLVLAKAVEKLGAEATVDLVMCGMASTDASGSVVPAMIAEHLDLPQVTLGSVIERQGDQVRIKRDGDTSTEVIGATTPLVLSVTDQSGEARYPSFKGIMARRRSRWRAGRSPTSASTPARSASRPPGRSSRAPRSARRAPPARSSPTRTAPAPGRWSTSSPPRSSSEPRDGRRDRHV